MMYNEADELTVCDFVRSSDRKRILRIQAARRQRAEEEERAGAPPPPPRSRVTVTTLA
eukprot:CAMPEP_0176135952 /NCGR_PEP_ID=MMETSP0120_2-20121206/68981_1 /TAXON_ID=160619 /ORGANISM="Kryptoperidinium foliaceum, Strain CCMP 1326" /LENGTH=57 /DNA_ID=CAMNT_0017471695 /DNA_START=35 /DNA_END=204 /DNA_ORIENTATION=+